MKTHEVFTLCLLVLSAGIALGFSIFSVKMQSRQNFYIKQCIANNKTDYLDTSQVEQCKHSFETFRAKE